MPRLNYGIIPEKGIKVFFGPANKILVLIALASSEGPGETSHRRSLARAFSGRIHTNMGVE